MQCNRIAIGDSVIIDDYTFIVGGERSYLGSFIHIASFVSITGGGRLSIGNFVNIATGCKVLTGTDNYAGANLIGPTVPNECRNVDRSFISIERFVALGAGVIVLPGVTIGQGAIIGAGSLILKDCDPWTIYVGSPARALKKRDDEDIAIVKQMGADVWRQTHDADGNYIARR